MDMEADSTEPKGGEAKETGVIPCCDLWSNIVTLYNEIHRLESELTLQKKNNIKANDIVIRAEKVKLSQLEEENKFLKEQNKQLNEKIKNYENNLRLDFNKELFDSSETINLLKNITDNKYPQLANKSTPEDMRGISMQPFVDASDNGTDVMITEAVQRSDTSLEELVGGIDQRFCDVSSTESSTESTKSIQMFETELFGMKLTDQSINSATVSSESKVNRLRIRRLPATETNPNYRIDNDECNKLTQNMTMFDIVPLSVNNNNYNDKDMFTPLHSELPDFIEWKPLEKKPFYCTICVKSYVNMSSIREHIKYKHHPNPSSLRVQCEKCLKHLANPKVYKQHKNHTHSINLDPKTGRMDRKSKKSSKQSKEKKAKLRQSKFQTTLNFDNLNNPNKPNN